jgi:hypothetical protein
MSFENYEEKLKDGDIMVLELGGLIHLGRTAFLFNGNDRSMPPCT